MSATMAATVCGVGKRPSRFEEEVAARIARSQALLSRRPSASPSPVSDASSTGALPPPLLLSSPGGPAPPALEPPPSARIAGQQQWDSGYPGGEITPPIIRSSESLSVAHILAGACDATCGDFHAEPSSQPPSFCRSPSIEAAASALFASTQPLSEDAAAHALLGIESVFGKSLEKGKHIARGTRRRLDIQSADTEAPRHARNVKRRRQNAAADSSAEAQPQQSKLWVDAIGCHVSLLSGATPLQLKMLAAAFQLCPQPTDEQIEALACHVSMPPDELHTWFESRRTLQEWVLQQGTHLQPATLAKLFYPEASVPSQEADMAT